MKITKRFVVLVVFFSCLTSGTLGYVMGVTNFDMFGYPTFNNKSFRPTPPHSRDSNMVTSYSNQVNDFIRDARRYIQAADNDIRTIEIEKRDANRQLREVLEEYDRFMHNNNNNNDNNNNNRPGRPGGSGRPSRP